LFEDGKVKKEAKGAKKLLESGRLVEKRTKTVSRK